MLTELERTVTPLIPPDRDLDRRIVTLAGLADTAPRCGSSSPPTCSTWCSGCLLMYGVPWACSARPGTLSPLRSRRLRHLVIDHCSACRSVGGACGRHRGLRLSPGAGDMLCRVVARSNTDLQRVIDAIVSAEGVGRSAT